MTNHLEEIQATYTQYENWELIEYLLSIIDIAQDLFDNRLGWSDNRNPYAPRELWANLGSALYGEIDKRVQELRKE